MKKLFSSKKILILMIMTLLSTSPLTAATYWTGSNIGSSADMIGIGNITGFTKNASSLLDNPAGLHWAEDSASIFCTNLFQGDVTHLAGAISVKVAPKWTIGLGYQSEGSKDLDHTGLNHDDEVVEVSTFDYVRSRYVLGANYDVVPKTSIGVSWVQYQNHMDGYANGTGGDITIGIRQDIRCGELLFSIQNVIGNSVKYDIDSLEKLAREYTIGYKSNPLAFANSEIYLQLKALEGIDTPLKSAGIRFYPLKTNLLTISGGYKEKYVPNDSAEESITYGVSLNLNPLFFEYAYDTTDIFDQESQHYFSVGFKF
jgi:hypothetical protein